MRFAYWREMGRSMPIISKGSGMILEINSDISRLSWNLLCAVRIWELISVHI